VGFYLKNVAMLAVDAGGQIVQLLLGICRKYRLSAAERYFRFCNLLVLVQAIDRAVQLVHMAGRTLGRRSGLLRLVVGSGCHLVGCVGGDCAWRIPACDRRQRPECLWSSLRSIRPAREPVIDGVGLFFTHFLRAQGFTRPQKPSRPGVAKGAPVAVVCWAVGGALCGVSLDCVC